MGLFDLFKKKNSGDVAKDRLKLLLVYGKWVFMNKIDIIVP